MSFDDSLRPLEIGGPADGSDTWPSENHWPIDPPEPTTLIAFWLSDPPPTLHQIIQATGDYLGVNELGVYHPPDEEIDGSADAANANDGNDHHGTADADVQWLAIIDLPEAGPEGLNNRSLLCWCERAQQVAPGTFDDADAERCPWVIGFEMVLDNRVPLQSFRGMVCLAGSLDQVCGVLDVNSTGFIARQTLDDLYLNPEAEPPAHMLWTIQVISGKATDNSSDHRGAWLHTHGLNRAGLPELEMIEVDDDLATPAAELMDIVAEMLVDTGAPPPGQPIEVGQGASVTLQPWQEAASLLPDDAIGSHASRKHAGMDAHGGARAAICDTRQRGSFRKAWVWPREVVSAIDGGSLVTYKSSAASRREAKQAQATWSEFAQAVHTAKQAGLDELHFVIKASAAQPVDSPDATGTPRTVSLMSDRPVEHLWFEVHTIDGEQAVATLDSPPTQHENLRQGDTCTVHRNDITGWALITPVGSFECWDVQTMWRALEHLKHDPPAEQQ